MRLFVICILFAFVVLAALVAFPGDVFGQAALAPGLSELVDRQGGSDSLVNIVVFLEEDNRRTAMMAAAEMSRDERIKRMTAELQGRKAHGRDEVARFLQTKAQLGIQEYWVTPAFAATVPVSELVNLANIDGVRLVVENVPLTVIEPVDERPATGALAATVSQPLQQLKVPALWQRGLSGKGRLICSFDTGVEYDHPALASKWRGTTAPLSASWFSKVAPAALPADVSGHGTHTMGIMLGSAGSDTIGVAPGAQWISAGVIDQGRPLGTTIADIIEAFQWALNPDGNAATTSDVPDVILNSWGIPKGLFQPCDETFATVIENVEAAGIVTIFAAGNEGPTPMSLRNPADMVLSPLCSFAVGAVDNYNIVAGFSSRGPASCDQLTVKPDVVAPGVNIRSSHLDGTYKLLSGTSMAAPYIAGLVALIREYNPNASVDQIKNAFILASTDLGTAGKDNNYGNGLVDASRLLEHIADPTVPVFSLSRVSVSGDGLALPGEQVDLSVTVGNASGNLDLITGRLVSKAASGVSVLTAQTAFSFSGTRLSAINQTPLVLLLSDTLHNGLVLPFQLLLSYGDNVDTDTLTFNLVVGIAPNGTIATHHTDELEVTVSDFGMFGLAPGSIYNIRGEGFSVAGSDNLLYEAGIILGRNALQLSSGVRSAAGGLAASDFTPLHNLSDEWTGSDGGYRRSAQFSDRSAQIPIPITVRQETAVYPSLDNNGLLIVTYRLQNTSLENISNLSFGLLVDFDLTGMESVGYDQTLNLVHHAGASGPQAGLVGLSGVTSFKVFDNGEITKRGFTKAELFDIISRPGVELGAAQSDDRFFIVSAGPFAIPARDSVEVSFAFVGGRNQSELFANAAAARRLHDQATGTDTDGNTLPAVYELHQNYPNPFNPSTKIAFSLPGASEVSLRVYNSLGQEVAVLHEGRLAAGQHSVEWQAGELASGVYFYRLSTEGTDLTRKMVLLK